MPPKPRFTVDVQTFTNAVILLVGPAAIYFGFRGEKRTDEEIEVDMEARQPSSMTQARKGSEALASIFAARKESRVGSRRIFWVKESGVGKARESE